MMHKLLLSLSLITTLAACRGDETLTAYGAADKVWRLIEVNSQPYTTKITLIFPEPGTLAGTGPCNTYAGAQTVPYPWFKAEKIASTKRNCPQLSAEVTYLTLLSNATLSEVLGDTLILSNDAGMSMVFKSDG